MGWQQWIRTVEIAPAIEAREVATAVRDVEALLRTGAKIIHVNGPPAWAREAVETLRPVTKKYDAIIDVHVGGNDFAEIAFADADSVTFDASAVDDIPATIAVLHGSTPQVGVAFGLGFDPKDVAAASAGADLVLCAWDGVGGTDLLRQLAVLLPSGVTLQIEGDVSHETVRELYNAGARVMIADRPIFEREDLPRAYRRLVQALA